MTPRVPNFAAGNNAAGRSYAAMTGPTPLVRGPRDTAELARRAERNAAYAAGRPFPLRRTLAASLEA